MEVSRSPEEAELLTLAFNSLIADVHTCMPGRVVSYDAKTQKAVIKPTIKRLIVHEDGEELLEALPEIPDVPIFFGRGGGFFITFPLEPGDLVELRFSERSLDNYLSGEGDDTDPDEFRMFDLSDAIATPGLYPFKRAIKDIHTANLVIGKDNGGIQIHLTPEGVMELKHSGESDEAVALGNALKAWWDTAIKPWLDTHIHPSGMGPTGAPAAPSPEFDPAIISKFLKLKK